jgi:hypothetical protein
MPMGSRLHGSVRGAYEFAIDLLGVNAVYTSTDGTVTHSGVIGFRNMGRDNPELVNAYGPGVVALTCRQSEFPTAPAKFDTFLINGMTYVVQASHAAILNADVIGWRVYVTGK